MRLRCTHGEDRQYAEEGGNERKTFERVHHGLKEWLRWLTVQ